MRIIINIDTVKDPDRNDCKTIRIRTGYTYNTDDRVRVINCGTDIYDLVKEAFGTGVKGGVVIHEGRRA